jgi:transcriptional regulator with XRE-family HTH domain
MSSESEIVSSYLSRNMFNLRLARNLSQAELSRLSGLPRSTVTHIESGSGNPSLRNLIKLANALGVSIEELLARPRNEVNLVRSEDLPSRKKAHGAARITQLLPDTIPGMTIERVELEVGGRLAGAPHLSNSKEYITVIAGHLEISVAGQTHQLQAGDVLAYPGDQPHHYGNVGRGKVTFLSMVAVAPIGMV